MYIVYVYTQLQSSNAAQRTAQKESIMIKNLFTAQAIEEQQAINAIVVSTKNNAVKAERTALNSSIIRKNEVTTTALLDFALITCLSLSDNYSVTSQQVAAFLSACDYDIKSSRIEKHVKDNKLAVVSQSLITLDESLHDFYSRTVNSVSYQSQLLKYAKSIFAVIHDLVVDSAIDENIVLIHEQAIVMNNAHVKQIKKTAKKRANSKK